MLPLAHMGITVGIAWGLQKAAVAVVGRVPEVALESDSAGNPSGPIARASRIDSVLSRIDYRVILLGSMLPDVIDKPLGFWFLDNGRTFGHSLLFTVLLAAVGFFMYIRRQSMGLLCLAFGTLIHLILDRMWLNPGTLLWPLYGWSFGRVDIEGLSYYLKQWLLAYTIPWAYVPEIIGAVVLVTILFYLIRRGTLRNFIRDGRLE